MAQVTQIVPKFSYPYVETVINDYTQVNTSDDTARVDPIVTFVFPFISSKGIDNEFVRKTSRNRFVSTYGESNYKKYGQPLMMPLNILEESNTHVWCMRVMPENAAYSNNVVSLSYKVDPKSDDVDASARKFNIKFSQNSFTDMMSKEDFDDILSKTEVTTDDDGYTQIPFMAIRSMGRGTYGDNYSVRINQNISYEKEYGIKMYNFDILAVEGGLNKIASYTGSIVSSTKYDASTLINDILDNSDKGDVPVLITINEDNLQELYDSYVEFIKEQHVDLQTEYDTKYAAAKTAAGDKDLDSMIAGLEKVDASLVDAVNELIQINKLIDQTSEDSIVDFDEFDPLFATNVANMTSIPCINIDSETSSIITSVKGITLSNGSNGYFDNPRTVDQDGNILTVTKNDDGTITYTQADGTEYTGTVTKWTFDQEVEECYINAFNGTYDRRILAPRRIPVNAFFDANYSFAVKKVIADLAVVRNDAICYLDAGIDYKSYSAANINSLIKRFDIFDSCLVSKNIQHFVVKETPSQKKVTVSITYFLARQYAYHIAEYGYHIPFVKKYAQLSGHVRDSLEPSIEDYESDLKEILYENRFNYFETLDEDVFQRSTQCTSQKEESDLIEENNVAVLYSMKRIIERDVQNQLYNFADETNRTSFTEYEKAKFASWIGSKVLSFDIEFKINEWEFDHSILHAYIVVVFRGLQKRAIVEIDINKRTYVSSTSGDSVDTNSTVVL